MKLRAVRALVVVFAGVGFAAGIATAGCGAFLESDTRDPAADDGGPGAGDANGNADGSSIPDGTSSTCTDTKSDPKNCGACGHDCLGGECIAEKCQPVEIASTSENVPWLTLDATRVIWMTGLPTLGALGDVYACDKTATCGTAAKKLSTGTFKGGALGSDGTKAYVSKVIGPPNEQGLLEVITSGLQPIAGLNKDNVLWIFPQPDGVYVNAYYEGDASDSRSIYRADLGDKLYAPIATSTEVNTDPTAITSTHVYIGSYNQSSALFAAPRSGPVATFKQVLTGPIIGSLTSDGARVYFTTGTTGGPIQSCPGDGSLCSARPEIATDPMFAGQPRLLLAAAGRLYFATTGGDLVSCTPNDCSNSLTHHAHETEIATQWSLTASNIAVDANAVYYVAKSTAGGTAAHVIKRVAR